MLRFLRINLANLFCFLSLLLAWRVAAQTIASQAYTPMAGDCPEGFTLVRMAGEVENQTLSAEEAAYIQSRRENVLPDAWKTYLANVEATGATLPSYVSSILSGSSSHTPNLGIAASGGGYRAAIFSAGVLNTLDGRNDTSNCAGLGGLLQATSYFVGLSGSAWTVMSLALANFPKIQELIFGYADASVSDNPWGGWNADYDILTPSPNPAIELQYMVDLTLEIQGKRQAGYDVTLADLWARMLSRHFVNGTSSSNFFNDSYSHGAGTLWSSVAETESFKMYQMPFPIVVADIIAPDQNISNVLPGALVALSNPIIEFNIFETGSYDPMLSAFVQTKYLGTTNESTCVERFDQASFVAASSAMLMNELGLPLDIQLDSASIPNPFYGVASETFVASNQPDLMIVDGGEDGETIPLDPLLVKARGVDTILAIDASAVTSDNYSNGSPLIVTLLRTRSPGSPYSFPPVPTTTDEFIELNLTKRPTFFGCNVESDSTPLLIYIANGGPPDNGQVAVTNTTTLQLSYSEAEIQAMLDQTFTITTQGYPESSSMTEDPEWPACLACAVVDRARERAGETRSGLCETCLERYCWS